MLRLLTIVTATSLLACDQEPPADWRFGFNISGLQFVFYDETEGIYPSDVVLENPNNPFRNFDSVSEEMRFDVNEGGNAGAFYSWATRLARSPGGENQFYAAASLAGVWAAKELEDEDELETVRLMAIAGFQSVLDYFPDSVTFDATGTISFRLATPAYLFIETLGGEPEGNWVLVENADGGVVAVQGGSETVPLDDGSDSTEAEEEEEDES